MSFDGRVSVPFHAQEAIKVCYLVSKGDESKKSSGLDISNFDIQDILKSSTLSKGWNTLTKCNVLWIAIANDIGIQVPEGCIDVYGLVKKEIIDLTKLAKDLKEILNSYKRSSKYRREVITYKVSVKNLKALKTFIDEAIKSTTELDLREKFVIHKTESYPRSPDLGEALIDTVVSIAATFITHGRVTNIGGSYKESRTITSSLPLPSSIDKFKNLIVLDLSDNKFESLPDEIGNLSDLKELNLSGNSLKTLPETIGKLSKLQVLDLRFNHLESLPRSLKDLCSLKKISLGDVSNLKYIPLYTLLNLRNVQTDRDHSLWLLNFDIFFGN